MKRIEPQIVITVADFSALIAAYKRVLKFWRRGASPVPKPFLREFDVRWVCKRRLTKKQIAALPHRLWFTLAVHPAEVKSRKAA